MHCTKRNSRKPRHRRTHNQACVQGTPETVEVPEGNLRVISGYRRAVDNSANIPAKKFRVVEADSIDIGVSRKLYFDSPTSHQPDCDQYCEIRIVSSDTAGEVGPHAHLCEGQHMPL
jgi:hypothetical protein